MGVIETGDIDHLEEMLYHFSSLLHPNHYIIIDIMHNLVHLYAAKPNLSRPEKERKIQLCVTVLETLVKIDPGFTKWRGTLLQEMIHTVMMVSKEDYASKRITTREFHKRLSMCARKLEEAKKCLLEGFTSQKHQTKESRPRMDWHLPHISYYLRTHHTQAYPSLKINSNTTFSNLIKMYFKLDLQVVCTIWRDFSLA